MIGVSAVPRVTFFQDCYFKGWFFITICFLVVPESLSDRPGFHCTRCCTNNWGGADSLLQIGVFGGLFRCFCRSKETHIWTGISKSKCQSLSHFCTGEACRLRHIILCCNLWALNLAQSLEYLSCSALLYAPYFLLVYLHFILVCNTGFAAHLRH